MCSAPDLAVETRIPATGTESAAISKPGVYYLSLRTERSRMSGHAWRSPGILRLHYLRFFCEHNWRAFFPARNPGLASAIPDFRRIRCRLSRPAARWCSNGSCGRSARSKTDVHSQRVFEKSHLDAKRLSMSRVAARSIISSEV